MAAQLGADVTVVDSNGLGGSAVITDCVPSKTLIATAEIVTMGVEAAALGVRINGEAPTPGSVGVDIGVVNARIKALAAAQSQDVATKLTDAGVEVVVGQGRLDGARCVVVDLADGSTQRIDADTILLATGASPRVVVGAEPDGDRILNWEQVYDLEVLPERLIVVGSGVTGAEFASAYTALGSSVVLVSSRERVLPGEDADAAEVIEDVFTRRGMTVMGQSRADRVERIPEGVRVILQDGRVVEGTHCLMAVGSVPNTRELGLETAGVAVDESGFIVADRVSRTSATGVYAAGDCTGVMMLASVAAMQGRIAMWHCLGDAVGPLNLKTVSSNVFTDPEIATVGWSQREVEAGDIEARVVKLPLAGNARAKMADLTDGFVKIMCRPGTGIVVGGVVVSPRASELIFPLTIAVDQRLTVDQLAQSFTVYPSLSGSVAEAARQLHRPG